MKVKVNDRIIEATRLYSQKGAAEKMGTVPSAVYVMKLKGVLDIVNIGGFDMVVEPEEGFESLKKSK